MTASTPPHNRPPFVLTRRERKAILAGELTKLIRTRKPEVGVGDLMVVAYRGGGRQWITQDEREREQLAADGKPLTIDVPREPSVWLTFREPQVKDGEWETSFTVTDEREPIRTLARGGSSTSGDPGLKTRAGARAISRGPENIGKSTPKRIPKRGEVRESHTPLSERGYGGGGKTTVDEREAVDDTWLTEHVRERRLEEENELRRSQRHHDAEKLRLEMRLAETRRRGMTRATARIEDQLAELRGSGDLAEAA